MIGVLAKIDLGVLPQWLIVFGLLVAAWIFWRGGGGTAIAGLQDVNRELERQIKERDGKIIVLERINTELSATRDVAIVILPVIEAMQSHEHRAQERHEGTLKVLNLIAEHLGPDPNGNNHQT